MFLEAQARAAVQQEEEAEELLLDLPPQGSTAQCPRAPRQLCVDCDPPKAVAQTRCVACDKGLCGNCATTCTQGCEWHGTTLCRSCCLQHPCVPVPAEHAGQESGDEDGPATLVDSSGSEDGRDAVDSDWSDSSDSEDVGRAGAGASAGAGAGAGAPADAGASAGAGAGACDPAGAAVLAMLQHVLLFAMCFGGGLATVLHPLAALPAAYTAVLALTRLRPGTHVQHCRGCTMLCVCLATLLLGGGLGTALVAAAALALCPRSWLWWPPKQDTPPSEFDVNKLVKETVA